MTKPKIGIIGDGNVGSALRRGLERAGYQVRAVGKEPAHVRETGQWADVIVLAVPYGAVKAFNTQFAHRMDSGRPPCQDS